MFSQQQPSSFNYSDFIRGSNELDSNILLNKYFTSHEDLFKSPPQISCHIFSPSQSSNFIINDNIDYQQSPEEMEAPMNPQQQQQQEKNTLIMKKFTKMLHGLLMQQTRGISSKEIKFLCQIEAYKHKLPVKNLKRRFYDALKILKNISLIKSNEAKMIELNTENTKMMLLENLKEQLAEKQYHIELKKSQLQKLKDYTHIMNGILDRNSKNPSIASKKIKFPFNLIIHQTPAQGIRVIKPSRQSKYWVKIADENKSNEYKGYYQVLHEIMKDRIPIKTIQE